MVTIFLVPRIFIHSMGKLYSPLKKQREREERKKYERERERVRERKRDVLSNLLYLVTLCSTPGKDEASVFNRKC